MGSWVTLECLESCQCVSVLLASESVGVQKGEVQHYAGQGVRPRVVQEKDNHQPTVAETHVASPQISWLLR